MALVDHRLAGLRTLLWLPGSRFRSQEERGDVQDPLLKVPKLGSSQSNAGSPCVPPASVFPGPPPRWHRPVVRAGDGVVAGPVVVARPCTGERGPPRGGTTGCRPSPAVAALVHLRRGIRRGRCEHLPPGFVWTRFLFSWANVRRVISGLMVRSRRGTFQLRVPRETKERSRHQ